MPAGLKEGGHLVQVLIGLADVSSRTCRLPAPQTDAEAATSWSSSDKLSTVLCMILLIRTSWAAVRGGARRVRWWEREFHEEEFCSAIKIMKNKTKPNQGNLISLKSFCERGEP